MVVNLDRKSGILLHPTALPGSYGIGEIGPHAYRFVDFRLHFMFHYNYATFCTVVCFPSS